MSEEPEINKSDNNMKFAITIIIVLVALLAIAVFALQQSKNSNDSTDSGNNLASETTQNTVAETKDAGALGKNEVKLTNDNFKAEVEDYKGVVLVDFYLSTCPHCQNVAADVTAVSDELVGKAKVGKLDTKVNSETANRFDISGVPAFLVFKDGKQVEKVEGEKTKKELLDLVNKYLK